MLKKKIKEILPDWALNFYSIIRVTPEFLKVYLFHKKPRRFMPDFYSDEEVVDKIVTERMSLARFGDGEFNWILGNSLQSYQDYSNELSEALLSAINVDRDNLLVGISKPFFDSSECVLYPRMTWRVTYITLFADLERKVNFSRKFANTCFTRPWIDYLDKRKAADSFSLLKKIWENRDILIVEGQNTCLGVGNDLFSNVHSLARLICPAQNAFASLGHIESYIRENVSRDVLILAALGPAASVLAVDMSKEGFQIVDVGHIDVEYCWFLAGNRTRRPVVGRYVNECGGVFSRLNSDSEIIEYNRSIIKVIDCDVN